MHVLWPRTRGPLCHGTLFAGQVEPCGSVWGRACCSPLPRCIFHGKGVAACAHKLPFPVRWRLAPEMPHEFIDRDRAFGMQGGPAFEVFTPQGSNPLASWKVSPGIKKDYDRGVKGYVYEISGGFGSRMQLPNDKVKSMCLLQPFLALQVRSSPFASSSDVTTAAHTLPAAAAGVRARGADVFVRAADPGQGQHSAEARLLHRFQRAKDNAPALPGNGAAPGPPIPYTRSGCN